MNSTKQLVKCGYLKYKAKGFSKREAKQQASKLIVKRMEKISNKWNE